MPVPFPSLFGLVLVVLLICVLLWALRKILAVWGVGDPWATTMYVLAVLLAVSWAIRIIWWPAYL
jgi:hypothetical protein